MNYEAVIGLETPRPAQDEIEDVVRVRQGVVLESWFRRRAA